MSLENRSNSALFKRAEQLKLWEESKTNAESTVPKRDRRKVRFSAGCVFLAACAAGDFDEVDRLLKSGADIDTANVDGLTALHQACIDDNLEMVEFLVKRGADVNRGDNEGWTPLHASASCGFKSIARLLVEKGADVAAVNNDGELPVDIAESDEMEFLLLSFVTAKGIDCDAARNKEENVMLADAKEWLKSGEICDKPHPKTGATAMHVAAAKGYIQVMKLLLQAGADVNMQDSDGWTALHAAAHWAQKEACQLLVDNVSDMEIKNFVGQTAEDIADSEVLSSLQEMKKNQAILLKNKPILPAKRTAGTRTTTTTGKRRSMDVIILTDVPQGNDNRNSATEILDNRGVHNEEQQANEESEETSTTSTSEENLRNRVNGADIANQHPAPKSPPKPPTDLEVGGVPSWRRSGSARSRNGDRSQRASDQSGTQSNSSEALLRRTASLDSDAKELKEPLSPTSLPGLVRRSFVPPVRDEESETQRKAHAKRVRETRRSTQGVTLEEIKSAEQLVRKKHQQTTDTTSGSSQFLLEDASADPKRSSSSSAAATAAAGAVAPDPSVALALRKGLAKPALPAQDDKDQDKENDSRNAQATQGVIQRRRRPKRRSTGVVHVDIDEIDPDRQESGAEASKNSEEGDRPSVRLLHEDDNSHLENGDLDYKKLYEESRLENEKILGRLRRLEDEQKDASAVRLGSMSTMSETEKRERRSMERKLAEMEEELKTMEILKKENQKLKDENGALIRVISKLSK